MTWWAYVLVSRDGGRTYVGVSTDVERRLGEHNGERPGGAKATRAGRPWTLGKRYGPFADRGEAQQAEHAVRCRRGAARLHVPLPGGSVTPGPPARRPAA